MRLSDLQAKMVVNVKDGKHLGTIIDAEVNETGQILRLWSGIYLKDFLKVSQKLMLQLVKL